MILPEKPGRRNVPIVTWQEENIYRVSLIRLLPAPKGPTRPLKLPFRLTPLTEACCFEPA